MTNTKKIYIIVGEASGDLHGANLIKNLKLLNPNLEFRCWGGDLMQKEGATIIKHYRDLAFMGFIEVAKNLRTILGNIKYCKQDISQYQPDAVILIDYPGFNLRIAEFVKSNKITNIYYISPQVWAWKQSRVKKIKKFIDKMLVILPFEKPFYQKFDYSVSYVGHPLLDAIQQFEPNPDFRSKYDIDSNKKIIALLPGSRKQEILKKLPIMLKMCKHFKDYEFIVAGAPSQSIDFYQEIIGKNSVKVIQNDTYNLLHHAHTALVTSGTATLETALFKVPQVVCYKGGAISYQIAKRLVKVKFISLVNLIVDKEIVKELIQNKLNEKNLKQALSDILNEENRNKLLSEYQLLHQKLGGGGASAKAAKEIISYLDS